jgi:hypothetical protein
MVALLIIAMAYVLFCKIYYLIALYLKSYTVNGITKNNDEVMCQIIYCYNPSPSLRVPNGICTTGGTGTKGKF